MPDGLGGGQGNVGDGIGKLDAVWDKYLGAYKVVDDDTAGFWGSQKSRSICQRSKPEQFAIRSTNKNFRNSLRF